MIRSCLLSTSVKTTETILLVCTSTDDNAKGVLRDMEVSFSLYFAAPLYDAMMQ
jgi:hypothetical protein